VATSGGAGGGNAGLRSLLDDAAPREPVTSSPPPPVSITQGRGGGTPELGGGAMPPSSTEAPDPTGLNESGRPLPVDVTSPTGIAAAPAGESTPLNLSGPGPGPGPGSGSATPASTPASGAGTGGTPASGSPSTLPGATLPGGLPASAPSGAVAALVREGDQKTSAGDLLTARTIYNRALAHRDASASERESIRAKLAQVNATLVFSPRVVAGDPFALEYTIQSGDRLARIVSRQGLAIDWRLLERVNGINANRLRVGQKIKLLRGPFHAVVSKGDYRLDLFMGPPDEPENWTFVRSFRVGLGEGNSTPVGTFVVRNNSKLVNPHWVNPRTGQRFDADDPKNPIGEYWLGWEGVGDSAGYTGYGMHGTIEPESIGRQMSMGCVRMSDEDIKLIYELLVERISVVKVVP
jgi:hypothetical protein